jgi:hypothetical protein
LIRGSRGVSKVIRWMVRREGKREKVGGGLRENVGNVKMSVEE